MYVKVTKNKKGILECKNMIAKIKQSLKGLENKTIKCPKTFNRKQMKNITRKMEEQGV